MMITLTTQDTHLVSCAKATTPICSPVAPRNNRGVAGRKVMPADAVSLHLVLSREHQWTAPEVRPCINRFKMCWVDTFPNTAEMVRVQMRRQRAKETFIKPSVGGLHEMTAAWPRLNEEGPIPIIATSSPEPTGPQVGARSGDRASLVDLGEETLNGVMASRHVFGLLDMLGDRLPQL